MESFSAKYKQTLHTHVMERHHGVRRRHRQEDAYTRVRQLRHCHRLL